MSTFIRKSTLRFVVLPIVFVAALACSSKDPASPSNSPTCLAPSDDIIGWWPLDQLGTTAEELVDSNNGEYINDPIEIAGKVGGALRFDGVDDAIVVGDPGANWPYDITGSFSLEAWIMRDTDQTGGRVIAGKRGLYTLGIGEGRVLGAILQNGQGLFAFGTSSVTVGEWHHIAVTHDLTSRTLKVYLDGEVDNVEMTAGQPLPVNDLAFNIGGTAPPRDNGTHFDGVIDEVSVYTTALTAGEVREIYERGSVGKCKQ